jgi:hypothetical protein
VWIQQIGTSGLDEAYKLDIDTNGFLYVVGSTEVAKNKLFS